MTTFSSSSSVNSLSKQMTCTTGYYCTTAIRNVAVLSCLLFLTSSSTVATIAILLAIALVIQRACVNTICNKVRNSDETQQQRNSNESCGNNINTASAGDEAITTVSTTEKQPATILTKLKQLKAATNGIASAEMRSGEFISQFLACEQTFNVALQFAKQEYSAENILFWRDATKCKHTLEAALSIEQQQAETTTSPTTQKQGNTADTTIHKQLADLVETYLKDEDNAPMAINMPMQTRAPIVQKIYAYNNNSNTTSSKEEEALLVQMLGSCITYAEGNMLDTFSRLYKSPLFEQFLNTV